jgi:hypothetical protein
MRGRRKRAVMLGLWVLLVCVVGWWAVSSVEAPGLQVIEASSLQPDSSSASPSRVPGGGDPASGDPQPLASLEPSVPVRQQVLEKRGRISGTVLETDGRPTVHGSVMVLGPKGEVMGTGIDEEGRFSVLVVPNRYRVYASRWDGQVEVRSDAHTVHVKAGKQVTAHFELPGHYSGEPGFIATLHTEGFRVEGVYKDTPAQRLGLSKGDIILEVEGISTLEMSEQEFERALVGPEGTEVELHVRFQDSDGDWEGVVNLQRSALDGLFKKP